MEGDQQWLQGMAGVQGNAFQNYLGAQKQGAADQAAGWQDVARTSGTVAQENNLNQVGQMLAGVDQNIAGATTDQLRTALDLGQQLTDRDLQAQTTNAGFNMTSQQAAQDAVLKRWQMESEMAAARQAQSNADRDYTRQTSADDWTRQMDQARLDLDVGKASAEGAQAGAAIEPTTPLGKAEQDLGISYGPEGKKAYDVAQEVWSMLDADGLPVNEKNLNNWISAVTSAGAGKADPAALRAAAMQIWWAQKGTS